MRGYYYFNKYLFFWMLMNSGAYIRFLAVNAKEIDRMFINKNNIRFKQFDIVECAILNEQNNT